MALIQVNFSSSSLKRMVPIQVILPVEKLEGAAKLISMLEDKADVEQITPAELAAVRSIVETCAADLDDAWKEA